MTCIGGDPLCPCQDGGACHYRDAGSTKGLPIPPRPPNDRGQGRKPLKPEDRATVGSVRLTAAEWAKFRLLGGVAWLRGTIKRARTP